MLRNAFFYWLGLVVLFLNKIRYSLKGYHRPRTFSVADINHAIAYDTEVVDRWEKHLIAGGWPEPFKNATILELGSGADLGVGLILLGRGAHSYIALDKNRLLDDAPKELYTTLLNSLPKAQNTRASRSWEDSGHGKKPPLQFIHDPVFHLEPVAKRKPTLIVSNAAFEHFDDVIDTLTRLTRIAAPHARLCLTVDLQTHTRILRDRDPLNIYRYPNRLYRALHFPGIPNRVRPDVYVNTLSRLGWHDIRITPDIEISPQVLPTYPPTLLSSLSSPSFLQFTLTAILG